MNDTITVIGNLATPPEVKRLPDGTSVTSFRLASNRRKFDSGAGRFVDVDANYYTVSVYREFGDHVARSLQKGGCRMNGGGWCVRRRGGGRVAPGS